jgi:PKD repeat protein
MFSYYSATRRSLVSAFLLTFGLLLYVHSAASQGCMPATTCQPGNAPVANQSLGLGILRVQLAALDTITRGSVDGYQDYSCRARAAQLVRGTTYTLTVRTSPNVDEHVQGWLDYNGDGIFTPDELILASAAARQHTVHFTVPATALVSSALRLRLAADYSNAPVPTACSTPLYSQTEDYRVLILPIAPPKPQVLFTALDTVSCSGNVAFRDDSWNAPSSWLWSFGDGIQSSQQHPTHRYTQPGTYTVRLRACNATGCDSLTKLQYIHIPIDAPRPASCQPTTSTYCCGFGITRVQLASLDHASADGQVGYEDFSCGYRTTLTADHPSILQLTTGPSDHDVRVYLDLNDDGQFDPVTERLYQGLNVRSPLVSLLLPSATAGLVLNRPLRLRLYADAAGAIFNGPCTAPQSGQIEDYSVIVAANTVPPTAAFTLAYQQLCGPVHVSLTNQTTGGASSYHWDFGDGTTTSGAVPAAHTYRVSGVYRLRLIATNQYGSDTAVTRVLVANNCPSYCPPAGVGGSAPAPAYFTRLQVGSLDNRLSRGPGIPYYDFTDQQVTLQAGQVYTLRTESLPWSFSGGGPWIRLLAWIDYNQNGSFSSDELLGQPLSYSPHSLSFTVPLRAKPGASRLRVVAVPANQGYTTWGSCFSSAYNVSTEDYTVLLAPAAVAPRAGFSVDLSPSCSGTVQLRDTSWAMPTHWQWEFGDGSTSTEHHPQHTYAQPGSYTVSLLASNSYGTSTVTRASAVVITGLEQVPRPAACLPEPGMLSYGQGVENLVLGPLTYHGVPDDAGYRDESCTQAPSLLVAGTTYPVYVNAFQGASGHVFIWLDANDDGMLQRTAELLFDSRAMAYNQNPKTGTFSVPLTAAQNRLLRLRMQWAGNFPADVPDPCNRSIVSGQVRDFAIFLAVPTATTANAPIRTWQAYPNPSTGWVTISGAGNADLVEVYDTAGRLVRKSPLNGTGQRRSLNLCNFPNGLYLLRIQGQLGVVRLYLH